MWNTPSKEKLAAVPKLYETEHIPLHEKIIHLHFFLGGCDWYIAEYDDEDLFWGFAILHLDYVNAEWGYISFNDLKEIRVKDCVEVDFDLHWKVRPACEVETIMACHF